MTYGIPDLPRVWERSNERTECTDQDGSARSCCESSFALSTSTMDELCCPNESKLLGAQSITEAFCGEVTGLLSPSQEAGRSSLEWGGTWVG